MTMLVGMKVYIVPQLDVSNSGQSIDMFLKLLLYLFLSLMIILVIGIFYIRKQSEYQRAIFLVKSPLIGKIYLSFYHFLILQGLGMQLASGMNLFDICESNKRFQKNSIQAYLAEKFVSGLTNGESLLKLIDKEPLLPKQLQVVIQAGESGRQLADDLLLMSELKFEETQRSLKRVLNLVQPLLFGVIAIVIVVTYLIVLLPIYGMMRGMSA